MQTLHVINIQRRKASLANLGGISWSFLEVAGKVGQNLDGKGREVKTVQTRKTTSAKPQKQTS